jgi:hypothetical protein
MLQADSASQVASNAFLKLCRLDVAQETERWARTAPKFALDGRVAVVTVDSGFQGTSLPYEIPLVANRQCTPSSPLDGPGISGVKARSSLWLW